MVHLMAHNPPAPVTNPVHQHAFVIVGDKTRFAVHMTQFHCEVHKYQLIFEFEIRDKDDELSGLRQQYPDAALFLCNDDPEKYWFSVPDLATGRLPFTKEGDEFLGNIFVGLRLPPAHPPEHFFPWKKTRAKPAIADVTVKVKRIVLFRPYAHHESWPPCMTYYIWGAGDEAHMTNKQNAAMPTGRFQAQAFGPDVDFVMSLQARPGWIADESILRAGIVVSRPDLPNFDAATGQRICYCETPFRNGQSYDMLYRGINPARPVTAGPTFMNCSAVINSPSQIHCTEDTMWGIFEMPKKYWGRED